MGSMPSAPPPPPPMPVLAPPTPMPVPDPEAQRIAAIKDQAVARVGKTTRQNTIIGDEQLGGG